MMGFRTRELFLFLSDQLWVFQFNVLVEASFAAVGFHTGWSDTLVIPADLIGSSSVSLVLVVCLTPFFFILSFLKVVESVLELLLLFDYVLHLNKDVSTCDVNTKLAKYRRQYSL